ncbi:MAG TPA: hypothetical protein ENI23_13990 [bacterium]|nr:hypothetical protein [bacterium]
MIIINLDDNNNGTWYNDGIGGRIITTPYATFKLDRLSYYFGMMIGCLRGLSKKELKLAKYTNKLLTK